MSAAVKRLDFPLFGRPEIIKKKPHEEGNGGETPPREWSITRRALFITGGSEFTVSVIVIVFFSLRCSKKKKKHNLKKKSKACNKMESYIKYLVSFKFNPKTLKKYTSGIHSVFNHLGEDHEKTLEPIVTRKEEIKKLLLSDKYRPSTVTSITTALKAAVRSLNLENDKNNEVEKFYSEIQRLSIGAHRTMLNPNRILHPRRDNQEIRTSEAVKKYQENLREIIAENYAIPPVKKVYRNGSKPRTGILPSSISNAERDILKRIKMHRNTMIKPDGKQYEKISLDGLESNIKKVLERYTAAFPRKGDKNLDFLIKETDNVVKWLGSFPPEAVHTVKSFQNAIQRFLPVASGSPEERAEAFEKYNTFLKTLPRNPGRVSGGIDAVKEFRGTDWTTGEKNVKYTWDRIVKNIQYLIKNNKLSPMEKMFGLLFTTIEPRRTRDYEKMLINSPDDKKHNILNLGSKTFIFNSFKNSDKTGSQHISIKNESLVRALKDYIGTDTKRKYLFEDANGNPVLKSQIQNILWNKIGRAFDIPTGTNALRHMFVTWLMNKKKNPKSWEESAARMGSSTKMWNFHYFDPETRDIGDEQELHQEKETEDLDATNLFEDKEQRAKRLKLESQQKIRSTNEGRAFKREYQKEYRTRKRANKK